MTIDQETNHECTVAYEAGAAAGKLAYYSCKDRRDAVIICAREAAHQEDADGYKSGFWAAWDKEDGPDYGDSHDFENIDA